MPRLRFIVLATGSRGNCALIASPHAQVLIDAGIGPRKLAQLLREHGLDMKQIDAILISHNHSDHMGQLGPLLRSTRARVYCHVAAVEQLYSETLALSGLAITDLRTFADSVGFRHRDLDVLPTRVSHDAEPTVMYRIYLGKRSIGVVTDLGTYDKRVLSAFAGCDVLLLEANHCPELLKHGPYPEHLKRRIRSDLGHLSNRQSVEFALSLPVLPPRLFIGHLSEVNNRPELASAAFNRIEIGPIPHRVIAQHECGPLVEL